MKIIIGVLLVLTAVLFAGCESEPEIDVYANISGFMRYFNMGDMNTARTFLSAELNSPMDMQVLAGTRISLIDEIGVFMRHDRPVAVVDDDSGEIWFYEVHAQHTDGTVTYFLHIDENGKIYEISLGQ